MSEIYELYEKLSWNSPQPIQESAILEARSIQDLGLFIQPMMQPNPKAVWKNCARVLADRSDEELVPHLPSLLQWLQDMNWPGADLIKRLAQIPLQLIRHPLALAISSARQARDEAWLSSLLQLENHYPV